MKQIWNACTTILVLLVLLLAMLLWGPRLLGMGVFIVQSGSMEPEYPVGSVVYVKEVDPAELTVGDVITFNLSDTTRGTHRIIEVVEEDGALAFKTKGDANDYADSGYVLPQKIVGKVIFSLPWLGYFVTYIQSAQGRYIALAAAALLLLLLILPELLFDNRKTPVKNK